MTKVCRVCLKDVDVNLFHDHSKAKDGKMKVCIECHKERCGYSDHDSKHRTRMVKNSRLMCDYGITIDEYEAMEKNQGLGCAICGGIQSDDRGLAVDHNHDTGKVRGLLCSSCNRAMGGFKDSSVLLRKAADYLDENN